MDEYRFASTSPLDLSQLFYHIHHSLQVGALTIWCPAGDVELSHLVCLLRLKHDVMGGRKSFDLDMMEGVSNIFVPNFSNI